MEGPMRVAQVMGYMNGGGVESVVMNYYRHIDREKVQFDFIVCEGSNYIPKNEIESLGGRVIMVPDYKKMPQFIQALISVLKCGGWKIVHSHMNSLSLFPLYAAKRACVPIRIAHSHTTSGKDGFARNLIKNGLCHFSRLFPTHLAACSEQAGEWLFGVHQSYTVFPNGIDVDSFERACALREDYRTRFGFAPDDLVLGHVGRFVKVKNHSFLLEIFQELTNLYPSAKLLLVGDGPLRGDIERRVEDLGLHERVRILGHRSDVPGLLATMDVFCLPSLYEGMPVVGVECQAAGVPILVSGGVTKELKMSSLVEYESLTSSPKKWAAHIVDLVSRSSVFYPSWASFDINNCARLLCCYYLQLEESLVTHAE